MTLTTLWRSSMPLFSISPFEIAKIKLITPKVEKKSGKPTKFCVTIIKLAPPIYPTISS